jgi:hypothetical protein
MLGHRPPRLIVDAFGRIWPLLGLAVSLSTAHLYWIIPADTRFDIRPCLGIGVPLVVLGFFYAVSASLALRDAARRVEAAELRADELQDENRRLRLPAVLAVLKNAAGHAIFLLEPHPMYSHETLVSFHYVNDASYEFSSAMGS